MSRQLPPADPVVEWALSEGFVDYAAAVAIMEQRAMLIAEGRAEELAWLLEHPPLYTAGTSTKPADLLDPDRFPVHRTGRGGQLTYHGPGQRVVYLMLDLRRRGCDVRGFVHALESWLIDALDRLGVKAETRADRVGVWVPRPSLAEGREDKIAAIGIRVRRWVSFHGVALNVAPDLEHFAGIVPCGISGRGVTSLAELGVDAGMSHVDDALRAAFEPLLGTTRRVAPPTVPSTEKVPEKQDTRP